MERAGDLPGGRTVQRLGKGTARSNIRAPRLSLVAWWAGTETQARVPHSKVSLHFARAKGERRARTATRHVGAGQGRAEAYPKARRILRRGPVQDPRADQRLAPRADRSAPAPGRRSGDSGVL